MSLARWVGFRAYGRRDSLRAGLLGGGCGEPRSDRSSLGAGLMANRKVIGYWDWVQFESRSQGFTGPGPELLPVLLRPCRSAASSEARFSRITSSQVHPVALKHTLPHGELWSSRTRTGLVWLPRRSVLGKEGLGGGELGGQGILEQENLRGEGTFR